MWQALQIGYVILVIAILLVGSGLALYSVASFINRIGNPYDKW